MKDIVNQEAGAGWEFHSLANLTTDVAPDAGCFGFGGKPGFTTSVQILVFKR